MNCPSFERLIDFLDNRLQESDGAQIANHLARGCEGCAENRDWYQRVRGVAASDDSIAPPAWVLKRAVRVFDTARQRPRLGKRIGQAIAALVFDSFARPALAGVRSTETANRQLLYSAGDYSVDLQIAQSEQARADLIGQVLKEGETTFESVSGLTLNLAREGTVVFSTVTDAMGEFKISGMEPGVYDLRVELSEGSITVPDLPLIES
ncbi:MAG TPA: hypothetical protein VLM38_20590 [Blastocatellia bacterium]|nr:hypothetical protein [Blastocatellia bacterium]